MLNTDNTSKESDKVKGGEIPFGVSPPFYTIWKYLFNRWSC